MRNEKRTDAGKEAGILKAAHSDGDTATVAWTVSTSITQPGEGLQRNRVRLHSSGRRLFRQTLVWAKSHPLINIHTGTRRGFGTTLNLIWIRFCHSHVSKASWLWHGHALINDTYSHRTSPTPHKILFSQLSDNRKEAIMKACGDCLPWTEKENEPHEVSTGSGEDLTETVQRLQVYNDSTYNTLHSLWAGVRQPCRNLAQPLSDSPYKLPIHQSPHFSWPSKKKAWIRFRSLE